MNHPKELIDLIQSYGARIKKVDDKLRLFHPEKLPNQVKQQLKDHRDVLLAYLAESYLDTALKRAYHGYFWLLEQKQQQCKQLKQPLSNAHISVEEWRQSVRDVIGLNPCEVQIIENLFINSGQFRYYWNDRYLMNKTEFSEDEYSKFYEWAHTPNREYLPS